MVRQDLELEGIGNDHIETVLNFIRAQRHLVGQYMDEELQPDADLDVDLVEDEEEAQKPTEDRIVLDPQQPWGLNPCAVACSGCCSHVLPQAAAP